MSRYIGMANQEQRSGRGTANLVVWEFFDLFASASLAYVAETWRFLCDFEHS